MCTVNDYLKHNDKCNGDIFPLKSFSNHEKICILSECSLTLLQSGYTDKLTICNTHKEICAENLKRRRKRQTCGISAVNPLICCHTSSKAGDRHVSVEMHTNIARSAGVLFLLGHQFVDFVVKKSPKATTNYNGPVFDKHETLTEAEQTHLQDVEESSQSSTMSSLQTADSQESYASSHNERPAIWSKRTLKLDSGEIINIPNVIRSLSSSSLISQYLQLCEEDNISPLDTFSQANQCYTALFGICTSIPGIEFQLHCQHIHSQHCQSCIDLDETLQKVLENAEKKQIENKDALMFKVEKAVNDIKTSKHIVRSKNQEFARKDIADNMEINDVIIIRLGNEVFFAKTLSRGDNAGCYKSSLTLSTLRHEIGKALASYNFSEAQNGKRKLVQWDSLKPSKNAVQLKVISDWTDIAISDSYEAKRTGSKVDANTASEEMRLAQQDRNSDSNDFRAADEENRRSILKKEITKTIDI
ncbi:unnamed protein product [Mytilus coruscus]|uniref:Uncharacterized protein n=1 Tax=Mytilus coruscus TaxID=42192 RepID=A0A6J8A485_MYTCO|nr:unnamed protein product [Mytilus coruscus]